MRRLLLIALVGAAGPALADTKPAVTTQVLDVQYKDPSTGYFETDAASLAGIKDKGGELTACTKGFSLRIDKPSESVLHLVTVEVADDGKVTRVVPDAKASATAKCLAPLVARWTFARPGELMVRIGMMPPVKRAPKLAASYVRSLQAVCDAPTDTVEATVERVRAALVKHPDKNVEKLLQSLSGRWPSERDLLFGAVLANAGITQCKLRDMK